MIKNYQNIMKVIVVLIYSLMEMSFFIYVEELNDQISNLNTHTQSYVPMTCYQIF